jgi:site-specific DNA recombinase
MPRGTPELSPPIIQYAIVYIRVSSERQVENASLETQEKACLDYCARQGWKVLRIFREEGESAKTVNRTQLQESLRFCRENKTRPAYFVVYSVDRFARSGEDHDNLRRLLNNWDIQLRAATQALGERPEQVWVERILSGQAEYDNAIRKERTISGMGTRLSQGAWTFKAPLGYYNTKRGGVKTIIPDPERSELVRDAFERYATGAYKRQEVLEWITDKGLRTWTGKRLSAETFSRMLSNPLYAGRIVVQGNKGGAGKDWRIVEKGNFEPIVSEDVFEKVQALLTGRRPIVSPRRRANPEFPLRQFVKCGSCGKPLTGSKSTSRTGERYSYYHCQNKNCTAPVRVAKSRLEAEFKTFLHQLKPNVEYTRVFRQSVILVYRDKYNESLAVREKLERDLKSKREDKWKLNEAYIYRRAITENDFREMKEALEQEILTLEMKVNEARQDEFEIEELLDFSENLLLNAASLWNQSGLEQKQRLQQVLFPEGVSYAGGTYRTSKTNPMFNILETIPQEEKQLVAHLSSNWNRLLSWLTLLQSAHKSAFLPIGLAAKSDLEAGQCPVRTR